MLLIGYRNRAPVPFGKIQNEWSSLFLSKTRYGDQPLSDMNYGINRRLPGWKEKPSSLKLKAEEKNILKFYNDPDCIQRTQKARKHLSKHYFLKIIKNKGDVICFGRSSHGALCRLIEVATEMNIRLDGVVLHTILLKGSLYTSCFEYYCDRLSLNRKSENFVNMFQACIVVDSVLRNFVLTDSPLLKPPMIVIGKDILYDTPSSISLYKAASSRIFCSFFPDFSSLSQLSAFLINQYQK